MTQAYLQDLARFVRSHGHPCRIVGDKLRCASIGVVVSTGKAQWSIDTIEPSLRSVREWLGY